MFGLMIVGYFGCALAGGLLYLIVLLLLCGVVFACVVCDFVAYATSCWCWCLV